VTVRRRHWIDQTMPMMTISNPSAATSTPTMRWTRIDSRMRSSIGSPPRGAAPEPSRASFPSTLDVDNLSVQSARRRRRSSKASTSPTARIDGPTTSVYKRLGLAARRPERPPPAFPVEPRAEPGRARPPSWEAHGLPGESQLYGRAESFDPGAAVRPPPDSVGRSLRPVGAPE
jgi:hypothetical protein